MLLVQTQLRVKTAVGLLLLQRRLRRETHKVTRSFYRLLKGFLGRLVLIAVQFVQIEVVRLHNTFLFFGGSGRVRFLPFDQQRGVRVLVRLGSQFYGAERLRYHVRLLYVHLQRGIINLKVLAFLQMPALLDRCVRWLSRQRSPAICIFLWLSFLRA